MLYEGLSTTDDVDTAHSLADELKTALVLNGFLKVCSGEAVYVKDVVFCCD